VYQAGFVMKFDPAATQLLFSSYFGGGSVTALTLDTQGSLWITGVSPPTALPVSKDTPLLGQNYLAALSTDGSTLLSIFTAPSDAAGQAIARTSSTGITALGPTGALLTATPGTGPSLVSIGNSASLAAASAVAPYELVSLYGLSLGPQTPATAQAVAGKIGTSLNGIQVSFNGTPAPVLYAGPTQINAIVPSSVYGQNSATVQIVTPSGTINGPTMQVRPAQPDVFLAPGASDGSIPPAVAVNDDGSVNSITHPAALGSTVTVWATGTGLSSWFPPDGEIIVSGGAPTLPVSMFSFPTGLVALVAFGGFLPGPLSLEVLSAGDAVGMVAGVTRVSFRLPAQLSNRTISVVGSSAVSLQTITGVPFALQTGDAESSSFTLWLKSSQ
jgi:uncharacterized protein (TIGR03437 family)